MNRGGGEGVERKNVKRGKLYVLCASAVNLAFLLERDHLPVCLPQKFQRIAPPAIVFFGLFKKEQ